MPIEFRCTQCGKLLRVPDDTGGKQARCPACSTLLQIPVAAAAPAAGIPPGSVSPLGQANPYQSPLVQEARPQAAVNRLEFGDVYRRSWAIFRRNVAVCLVVVLIAVALNHVLTLGVQALVHGRLVGDLPLFGAVMVGIWLLSMALQMWLATGQTRFFLNVVQGKQARVGDLFSGTKWFIPIIGATVLFGLAVLVGYVLLFVPAVIVALMLSQYMYLIVDRDYGALESLRESRQLTYGNKSSLFGIYLVAWIIPMVVLISMAFAIRDPLLQTVGGAAVTLIVMPWFGVLSTVCYAVMSGQPTAEQLPATPPGALDVDRAV